MPEAHITDQSRVRCELVSSRVDPAVTDLNAPRLTRRRLPGGVTFFTLWTLEWASYRWELYLS